MDTTFVLSRLDFLLGASLIQRRESQSWTVVRLQYNKAVSVFCIVMRLFQHVCSTWCNHLCALGAYLAHIETLHNARSFVHMVCPVCVFGMHLMFLFLCWHHSLGGWNLIVNVHNAMAATQRNMFLAFLIVVLHTHCSELCHWHGFCVCRMFVAYQHVGRTCS